MDETIKEQKPPIKAGWRGCQNGGIENTNSYVEVSEITLRLDKKTAWALCNHLTDRAIKDGNAVEGGHFAQESLNQTENQEKSWSSPKMK